MGLDGANKALAAQSYDNALMTAKTVLRLDPENVEARAILVKAQEGKARQDRQRQAAAASQDSRRRKGEEIAAATPVPSEGQPPTPSAPVTRPEATTATVHVHFRSELPEGSLIIWANGQEILRDNYSSPRGGGINIFRARKQVPYVLNRTLHGPRRHGRFPGACRARGEQGSGQAGLRQLPGRRLAVSRYPSGRPDAVDGPAQLDRSGWAARGSPSGDQTVTGPTPSNCGSRISAGPTATTTIRSGSRWRSATSWISSRVTAAIFRR